MSEHIKEPLAIKYRGGYFLIIDAKGEVVADDGSAGDEYSPTMKEDTARRFVACVNACAGIPTDDLEEHQGAVLEIGTSYIRSRAEAAEAALDRVRSITVEEIDKMLLDSGFEIWNEAVEKFHRLLTERMDGKS